MRVLLGCECSGVGREAFRALGHDAWSCDLQAADDGSPFHLQCDVFDALQDEWDLAILHPECTFLTNAGVRWLFKDGRSYGQKLTEGNRNEKRWQDMLLGRAFFMACLNAKVKRVCVENPIPHEHAGLPPYTQIVHPWQHGHGERKPTCLWLLNLPKLKPTNVVEGREQRIWKMPPSKTRSKDRSRSFPGIMGAMAEQWGPLE